MEFMETKPRIHKTVMYIFIANVVLIAFAMPNALIFNAVYSYYLSLTLGLTLILSLISLMTFTYKDLISTETTMEKELLNAI